MLEPKPRDWVDYLTVAANFLGPIVGAFFGLWILRITKRMEGAQWRNQKLIEKRIAVWDQVGPAINDIFCYCMRVGSWKAMTPPEAIEKKRLADKGVHLSRPYFSSTFFLAYQHFVSSCFETFQGHGDDAKIRTIVWEHKNFRPDWQPGWDKLFLDTPDCDKEISQSYGSLLEQVHWELSPNSHSGAGVP